MSKIKLKTSKKRLSFAERELCVLDTAAQLFASLGFEGTTTQAIAKAANINEALIFRHFKSKAALYDAILNNKISEYEIKLSKFAKTLPANNHASPEEDLLALAHFIIKENKADTKCLRMMIYASLQNKKIAQNFFNKRIPLVEFTESFFKKLSRQGRLAKDQSPATCARLFLSTIHQYVFITEIFSAKNFYKVSENQLLRDYVKIFMSGASA